MTAIGTDVTATWDAPGPGTPTVVSYRVWFDTGAAVVVGAAELKYVVTGLPLGSWHQARVAAVNQAGQSKAAAGEITMPAAPTPTSRATAPTATPPEAPAAPLEEQAVDSLPEPSASTAQPPASTAPPSAIPARPAVDSSFHEEAALTWAEDIVEDITTIDERMAQGSGSAMPLSMLSTSFERLADAGVPPGLDAASYLASLDTLATFADMASAEMAYAPMEGSARYVIIRKETGPVLVDLGRATGTSFALP